MGENEDNIEEEEVQENVAEEKKFKIPPLSGILTEFLRLMIFSLVAILISYYMINQKNATDLAYNIRTLDQQGNEDLVFSQSPGKEWEMEEILINTSDDFANHFVKIKIIFSYSQDPTLQELTSRQNQIYAEVRKVIGVEKYTDLKKIKRQEELVREIKNRVQRILKTTDTINVYLKEFTIY